MNYQSAMNYCTENNGDIFFVNHSDFWQYYVN